MIRVTVWNEFIHEQDNPEVKKIYPKGMHAVIKEFLECDDIKVTTATLHDEECGLTEEVVDNTDVMIWWGHCAHDKVPDHIAERVQMAVLKGMGLIVLHSGHHSKPFKRLMGTTCNLNWRVVDLERIWVVDQSHPITQGLGQYFELEEEEMYGEPFGIPEPDQVLMIGWYRGGEVFRTGCTFKRGNGNIFYFQPGHEDYPTYYNETIQKIIKNAVRWANPVFRAKELTCPFVEKIEK